MTDLFNFSDPNQMGILGAIAGLGQAAMPSRMPVPTSAVLGQMFGGMQQGAQAAQQYQRAAQENALQNLTLQGWRNYMGQGSAAAPAGGGGGGSPVQTASTGTALPPGAKSPIGGGVSANPGNPLLDLPAMLSQARAGMFPGGPGGQMITPLLSYADTVAKQGYQPVINPDGSVGVAPLGGIDSVRTMLSKADAFGHSLGEGQQNIVGTDSGGNPIIAPMTGSIESASAKAGGVKKAEAAAEQPYQLQQIGARAAAEGNQQRLSEAYKTQLENANTTVAVPDGQGGTRLMLRGDANALAASKGAPPLPATLDAKDTVSPTTGTLLPAPTGQIKMGVGSAPNPEWIKEEQSLATSIGPAYQTEQKLQTLATALKATQSGTWATQRANVLGALKAAGIPISDAASNDVANVQKVIHENMLTTMGAVKDMLPSGSRMTQMEFDRIGKALANPDLQPGANYTLLTEAIGALRQNRALATSWQDAKSAGWSNPFDYQSQWFQKNPLQGFIDQAGREIGPLKGMKPALPAGVTAADIAAELKRRGIQ